MIIQKRDKIKPPYVLVPFLKQSSSPIPTEEWWNRASSLSLYVFFPNVYEQCAWTQCQSVCFECDFGDFRDLFTDFRSTKCDYRTLHNPYVLFLSPHILLKLKSFRDACLHTWNCSRAPARYLLVGKTQLCRSARNARNRTRSSHDIAATFHESWTTRWSRQCFFQLVLQLHRIGIFLLPISEFTVLLKKHCSLVISLTSWNTIEIISINLLIWITENDQLYFNQSINK